MFTNYSEEGDHQVWLTEPDNPEEFLEIFKGAAHIITSKTLMFDHSI